MIAPPPKEQFIEQLRSRIVEGRVITPYDYRAVAIPLFVTLGSSRLRGTASYTLPSNMRLRLRQVIAHVIPENVSSETITNEGDFTSAGGVFQGGEIADRLYAKAQNCRVSLAMASRTFDFFPQFTFPLSDLQSFNGYPVSLTDMPGIIPQGTAIDLSASLVDSGAAASDTEYGIILIGSLIRVD